ncbi:MAG TPA: MBL fold metallo-hydrolase [Terriglobales bacterium]|nr:MBL fold metallo-hydrolase [Terriglobales bacterium]
MKIERLDHDLYLARGEALDSNATIYVSNGEALLVDALGGRPDAQQLKAFVEGELGKRVRFILATHYFSDHLAGLNLFPEAQVLAHRNYRHTFDSEQYRSDEERSFFRRPDILLGDSLLLHWGRFTLDVFYNPGHTMSTLGVEVPEADLLHVGDTLVGNLVYFLYSTPELLAQALLNLKRRGRGRLLASHQGLASPVALDHGLHYLQRLEERVRQARQQSDPKQAILGIAAAECFPAGVTPTDFESFFHRRNLNSVIDRRLYE